MRPDDEDDESAPGCVGRTVEVAAREVTVHRVSTGTGGKSSERQKDLQKQAAGCFSTPR
jgi:hypothetical protein